MGGGSTITKSKIAIKKQNHWQNCKHTSKINSPHKSHNFTKNHSDSRIFYRLFVLHNDISSQMQTLLRENIAKFSDFSSLDFIDMSDKFAKEWECLGLKAHFSKEFFYKILLTSHFPDIDKIIVSDVDVVFLGDVAQSFLLFDCESNMYLAGVKANNPNAIYPLVGWKKGYAKFSQNAFNAIKNGIGGGYFIANLKAWRRDNIEAKLVAYLQENAKNLVLAEQDVLNIICYPKIATISLAHIVSNWHYQTFGENWELLTPEIYSKKEIENARDNPIQLHFVGDKKPWNVPSVPKSEIWYKYMLKTSFARQFLEILESKLNVNKKKSLSYRIKNKFKKILYFMAIK